MSGRGIFAEGFPQIFPLLLAGNSVINANGIFVYSAAPAAGNLLISAAPAAGTDAYGNAYPAGLTVYATASEYINLAQSGMGFIFPAATTGQLTYGADNLTLASPMGAGHATAVLGLQSGTSPYVGVKTLALAEQPSPPATPSGRGFLYVDSTGHLHYLGPSGTDTILANP